MNYFDGKFKIKQNKDIPEGSENDADLELDLNMDSDDASDFDFCTDEGGGDFKSGAFINSLNDLTEDDIKITHSGRLFRPSNSELARRAFLILSVAVFVVSCVLLLQNYISRNRGQTIYDELRNEISASGFDFSNLNTDAETEKDGISFSSSEKNGAEVLRSDAAQSSILSMSEILAGGQPLTNPLGTSSANSAQSAELLKMKAGLKSLAEVNPDIYGWISVSNTEIDYPMAQGTDNSYYLDHAYTGDLSVTGSIFVDFRCKKNIASNYNTVMYGHNLTTGGMFHDVTAFFSDDYFNNTYINIYTPDGIYVYEPFSIYETRYDYNYFRTEFNSAEEFVTFACEVRDKSAKKKDIDFTGEDRIITLSTCTNGAFYMRYALHAKLVKVITE